MKYFYFLIAFVLTINIASAQTLNDIYSKLPDVPNCIPGVLNESEKQEVLEYVNMIRSLHGLPLVSYDASGDAASQAANLLSVANQLITHTPNPSMKCYSEKAYEGCNESNLHMSISSGGSSIDPSTSSITGWMIDNKSQNAQDRVGHRRAIINPFLTRMSFGRADGAGNGWYFTGMSFMWKDYLDGNMNDMEIDYVAYPYNNYPPQLVDKSFYLSFSAFSDLTNWWNNGNVDYSNAVITIKTEDNQVVNTHSQGWDDESWGGTTTCLVWKADGLQDEVRYNVEIKKVKVNGQERNFSYWFKLTNDAGPEKFRAPELFTPENSAEEIAVNVDLTWEEITEAESYDLHVEKKDNQTGNISILLDETNITGTSFNLTNLEKATTYFWKVRSVKSDETSDWSEEFFFKTKGIVLEAPVLVYPINNAKNVDKNTRFEWEEVEGNDGYLFSLYYLDGNDTIYIENLENAPVPTETIVFGEEGLVEDINYKWQVRAVKDGVSGKLSVNNFELIEGGTNTPTKIKPAANIVILPDETEFEWTEIPGALHYELNIAELNDEDNPFVDETLTETTYTYDSDFKDKTQYIWKVRAYFGEIAGNKEYGMWGHAFVFTADSETSVTILSENSSIVISPNPAKDVLYVNSDLDIESVIMYDLRGNKTVCKYADSRLNISKLEKGVYILRIKTSSGEYLGKFIKE